MFFKIAETYEERKKVRMFWEEMRKMSEKIHSEFVDCEDDKYNKMFYKNVDFTKKHINLLIRMERCNY